MEFETAVVAEVLEDRTFLDEEGQVQGALDLLIHIQTGRYSDKELELTYHFIRLANIMPEAGDRVSVRVSTLNGEFAGAAFDNFERRETLLGVVLVFFLALGVIGGKKGLRSIGGLVFTLINIVFVLIPLMLRGWPVILTTVGILGVVAFVTLFLLFGFNRKLGIALTGCLFGVMMAALIGTLVGDLIQVNGLHMEEADVLVRLIHIHELGLNSEGLFISGILIASLGAVMDIAVSMISAMEEIKGTQDRLGRKDLFRSGMNVGRDMMGTMSNTLILAFAGTALNMIIVMYITSLGMNHLFNTDVVALEIIRAVSGSLGLVLTVPVVALLQAWSLTSRKSG